MAVASEWFRSAVGATIVHIRAGGVPELARTALIVGVTCLPWSIAAAQISVALALLAWAVSAVRRGYSEGWRHPLLGWWLAFAVLAVVSAVRGWRPELSVPKLHRLAWFLLMAAIVDLARTDPSSPTQFLVRIVRGLWVGCAVAWLAHAGQLAWAVTHVPSNISWSFWIFHQGSMRTPQFHMVALMFLLAGAGVGGWNLSRRMRLAIGLSNSIGVLWHFKRGVWMATFLGLLALVTSGCRLRRDRAMIVAGLVLLALAIGPVRARLGAAIADAECPGGRWELWTKAAPWILRKAPWGIGYGAMKNYELRHRVPNVEAKLNHLHNNALQVLVEMGWPGLLVWVGWMTHMLLLMARAVQQRCERGGNGAALARGVWASAVALLMNGLVEYNFGTGTILIWFAVLMGMAAVLASDFAEKEKVA